MRRRGILAAGAVALALAAGLGVVAFVGPGSAPARNVPTAFARVVRTDVIARQQVAGTLDFLGGFTVVNAGAGGFVTWLPAGGAIVGRGRPLFELDRRPVVLLYGSRPAYRDFALGMSGGADVRDLKRNLRALGYGDLTLDGRFDLATLAAVEQWQRARAVAPTGRLALGSIVFAPGAVRVGAAVTSVGAAVQHGAAVEAASATTPGVLVSLDVGAGAQVHAGDRVIVTMPDGSPVPGRVTAVGRIAVTASSSQGGGPPPTPTVSASIALAHGSASSALDQAPVQVAITTDERRNVLTVPVDALLAQPGGGYAVRTQTGLIPVTTGLFDDVASDVEVSGPGLSAGLRVEVPVQ
ncbi:MAG TPA: peptidoglycan-binding domain-containing protein [Gaiellaceae bacterium]|jgi:peptidoglycan hydrolase-like protein with peptidoglycan-binding domain|nr:peptidoglycan-binding domain-containing protein [Gaiellaceae bacterium]